MTTTHLTDKKFSDFALHESLLQGLNEAGFEFCTPIQAETLPHALAGKDVAGQAQTGTGKTMAFLLAAYQHLLAKEPDVERKKNQPRVLILAPTRELAIQIEKDASVIGRHTGLRLGLIYGGTGYDTQRKMLENGVDILVGTPGRLIDYFKQGLYKLDRLDVLILDEADRMFDMGFIKDIRYLLHRMTAPADRLSMLFSATLSHRVEELAYEHMNDPVEVKIESKTITADKITQIVYHPGNEEKLPLLVGLLNQHKPARTLIFVNMKWVAEKIYNGLRANGFKAGIISGDVPQLKRERLLQDFKDDKISILVATDVAARGLHIPAVSHVFNYDLPQDAEDYVHRIGRTARAGASGDAISFACEDTAYFLMDIEEFIGKPIPLGKIEPEMLATLKPSSSTSRNRPDNRSDRKDRFNNKPRDGQHTGPRSGDREKRRSGPHSTIDRRQAKAGKDSKNDDGGSKRSRPVEIVQVETPVSPSTKDIPSIRRRRDGPPAIG
ncbi:ATP-dependent RNA helicase RhlB [bacterium BMS3Bbin11]|nr:ATP-dependent RNA helicase RhlB [bacterium BMS3Abin11]GBE45237.1 ATP-dependent RNA helicase RhlB [bacterium BMS3Bbin11]HDH07889.1 ATP-dependent RNA helicase RhlB [Gammaproteobacteria bacterium]HDH17090.1 ATP-dependent RNA helicase RhlB [Gammaproteobacteria bacterium]HDZ78180.1 ATP-dependent RNA helicase RhlB [Gammaproteobacteria bacterium]